MGGLYDTEKWHKKIPYIYIWQLCYYNYDKHSAKFLNYNFIFLFLGCNARFAMELINELVVYLLN